MIVVIIVFLALLCAVSDFVIRKDLKFTIEFLIVLLVIVFFYIILLFFKLI